MLASMAGSPHPGFGASSFYSLPLGQLTGQQSCLTRLFGPQDELLLFLVSSHKGT